MPHTPNTTTNPTGPTATHRSPQSPGVVSHRILGRGGMGRGCWGGGGPSRGHVTFVPSGPTCRATPAALWCATMSCRASCRGGCRCAGGGANRGSTPGSVPSPNGSTTPSAGTAAPEGPPPTSPPPPKSPPSSYPTPLFSSPYPTASDAAPGSTLLPPQGGGRAWNKALL